MLIAITGATGFLGNLVARMAIERGNQVRLLIRKNNPNLSGIQAEIIYGDLENEESLNKLLSQADILVHYKTGEIFLVLCETEQKGAGVIKARIKARMREFSGDPLRQILEKSIIGVGMATYPSDASTQRELFRKAIKDAEEDSL